jgi:hypothetical protein
METIMLQFETSRLDGAPLPLPARREAAATNGRFLREDLGLVRRRPVASMCR